MAIFARHTALYTATELVRVTHMTTTAKRAALYNHELLCVTNMTKRAARYKDELLRVSARPPVRPGPSVLARLAQPIRPNPSALARLP